MIKQASSTHEAAELLGRRRTRFFAAQAVLFFSGQAVWITRAQDAPFTRLVDRVGGLGWLLWAAVLLALLARGSFLATPRAVREYLNDELWQAHRGSALAWGFWSAMVTSILCYALAMFTLVPVFNALHAIVSAGVGVALCRFVYLERRSEHG